MIICATTNGFARTSCLKVLSFVLPARTRSFSYPLALWPRRRCWFELTTSSVSLERLLSRFELIRLRANFLSCPLTFVLVALGLDAEHCNDHYNDDDGGGGKSHEKPGLPVKRLRLEVAELKIPL